MTASSTIPEMIEQITKQEDQLLANVEELLKAINNKVKLNKQLQETTYPMDKIYYEVQAELWESSAENTRRIIEHVKEMKNMISNIPAE